MHYVLLVLGILLPVVAAPTPNTAYAGEVYTAVFRPDRQAGVEWSEGFDPKGEYRGKWPELDRGVATLLADLADRGLLESMIVWCSGEFGRTPKVQWDPPWNGGRGRYGKCFSALIAGGGFKGGHVVGASNDKGMEAADRPVYPPDLIGSIYELLGIDPDGPLPNPRHLSAKVLPESDDTTKSPGRLKEIT